MRLGFWNRLAIVATGLGLLIAPVSIQMSIERQMSETRQAMYAWCYESANTRLDEAVKSNTTVTFDKDVARCNDDLTRDRYTVFTWHHWREYAGATLGIAAALYVLFGLFGIVGRWVWRGRDVKKNTK